MNRKTAKRMLLVLSFVLTVSRKNISNNEMTEVIMVATINKLILSISVFWWYF
jgi:hypothetical protein